MPLLIKIVCDIRQDRDGCSSEDQRETTLESEADGAHNARVDAAQRRKVDAVLKNEDEGSSE